MQGLDLPVTTDQPGELGGRGPFGGGTGDGVDGLDADLAGLALYSAALELDSLAGTGEEQVVHGTHLDPADLPRPCPAPWVRFCSGICFHGSDLSCLRSFFWFPFTITM
jgi:hypothetical protein